MTTHPLVSVFTPTHDPRFLDDAYGSLLDQTYDNWEWVILRNGEIPEHETLLFQLDNRVRVHYDREMAGAFGVGALKREAVSLCRGDILLELDHDDLLYPTAIQRVVEAFDAHPDAGMVYSHAAQVTEDLGPDLSTFDLRHGWTYRHARFRDIEVQYPVAMPATPHNLSLIWYAPNHLRAFTRAAYDAVGGYNADLAVLDDQDLMARLYLNGDFHLLDECLYLQRIHTGNTQRDAATNATIQYQTQVMQADTLEQLALAWAARNGLLALDLGGAHAPRPGFIPVDQHDTGAPWAFAHTFPAPMDLPDSSVGVIRASDFLEHVADKIAMWNELHRLLAPGGILLTNTPSTDGRGAWQDPTHVAGYNANSFWYFTQAQYAAYVPELTARFQVSRIVDYYPSEWHELHKIPYVAADLICLKGEEQPRNGGIVDW